MCVFRFLLCVIKNKYSLPWLNCVFTADGSSYQSCGGSIMRFPLILDGVTYLMMRGPAEEWLSGVTLESAIIHAADVYSP